MVSCFHETFCHDYSNQVFTRHLLSAFPTVFAQCFSIFRYQLVFLDAQPPFQNLRAKTLSTQRSHFLSVALLIGVSVFVSCVPLFLLINPDNKFYWDWYNHLWLVEYFGEYLRFHWTVPYVINTDQLTGLINPLFYGQKFYTALGCLSAYIGPSIAVRIGAFALIFLQFIHVERAFYESTRSKILSFTTGALLCWATYPLTNLYNRSALTEFFAVGFLNISVTCLVVLACRSLRNQKSYYDAVAVGLFYVAAAATHPLTAFFGGIFIAMLGGAIVVVVQNKWIIFTGMANAFGIGVILAPWLWLLAMFRNHIDIGNPSRNSAMFRSEFFFPNSIDKFWSRICPFPLDLRSLERGVALPTPYLDAQCIMGYFLLAGLLAYLYFNSENKTGTSRCLPGIMLAAALILFVVTFSVSIRPALSGMFGGFFDVLQFPYRLTSYINLSLLVIVLALGELCGIIREDLKTLTIRVAVITTCLSIATCSVTVKLIHGNTARDYRPPDIGREPTVLDLPSFFYGANDFAALGLYKETPAEFLEGTSIVPFRTRDKDQFGGTNSENIQLDRTTLVAFNIEPFPWNTLLINGNPVARDDLSYLTVNRGEVKYSIIAIRMGPGNYRAEYRFAPERMWLHLEWISWFCLVCWFAWWAILILRGAKRVLMLSDQKTL